MVATALLLLLSVLFAAAWFIRWTRMAEVLPRVERQSDLPLPAAPPRVSVILPARDEEDNIRECLESLLEQDYPDLEVIVVDDRSEDRTPEILRDIASAHANRGTGTEGGTAELRILQGRPCPSDWMGKNHALHQGYEAATGAFLLFVDADTRAAPQLVSRTVGFSLKTGTGLLTLIHACEFQCFWDSVVNTLILYLAPFQDIEAFNDPERPEGNANGPFMLFSRETYERIGGHKAIQGEVVEDLVIARNVKEAGERPTWAVAPELFVSRPYPTLGALRKGWTKVIFRCMEQDPRLIRQNLLLPFLMLAYFLFPWAVLGLALVPGLLAWVAPVKIALMSLALAQIVAVVAGQRLVEILFRLRPVHPWAYLLGSLVLAWMQWEACFRVLTGRKVAWKGRHYREGAP